MKKIFQFIVLTATLVLGIGATAFAADSYTYDHSGVSIYSTAGFAINEDPYKATDMGLKLNELEEPEDLFLYDDGVNPFQLYLTESSRNINTIYVLNETYKVVEKIRKFDLHPQDFPDDVLLKIKTNGKKLVEHQIISVDPEEINVNIVPSENNKQTITIHTESDYNDLLNPQINWTITQDKHVVSVFPRVGVDSSGKTQLLLDITGYRLGNAKITGKLTDYAEPDPTQPPTEVKEAQIKNYLNDLKAIQEGSYKDTTKPIEAPYLVHAQVVAKYRDPADGSEKEIPELSNAKHEVTNNSREILRFATQQVDVIGKKVGAELAVPAVFKPEAAPELATKYPQLTDFTYHFTVTSVKEWIIPPLTDEYIASLGLLGSAGQPLTNQLELTEFLQERLNNEKDVHQVEINVNVTAQPDKIPFVKESGFTLEELKKQPVVPIYLYNPMCTFRSVARGLGNADLLYVTDRGNNQVIVSDAKTRVIKRFVHSDGSDTFVDQPFSPRKVVADIEGRIYVLADMITTGIMQFSAKGTFDRFIGVNYVKLSAWDAFWRRISSQQHREQLERIVGTTFTSIYIDPHGFIYATSHPFKGKGESNFNNADMIKRINTTGKNVLKKNGYAPPSGDLEFLRFHARRRDLVGPSSFRSIAVNDYGVYSVIDSKTGRIFTYDDEGNLLYISGNGSYANERPLQQDYLRNPVSLVYHGDKLLVVDQLFKVLVVYEPTHISKLINKAVKLKAEGDDIAAGDVWEQVIKLNVNYEYAYIGIGRKQFALGNYKEAQKYFELGYDKHNYSRAFKILRDQVVRRWFAPVLVTIIVVPLVVVTAKGVMKKRKRRKTGTVPVKEVSDDE